MDWRALLQHPWFQLCLLVAVLSAGTLVFDAATGRLGKRPEDDAKNKSSPTPVASQAPPPANSPPQKMTAKIPGRWIVDGKGASDADSRDLRAIIPSLANGDTVTLRAGDYTGGFILSQNVRFIADGPVNLISSDRDNVTVTGAQASFERMNIVCLATGDQFAALRLVRGSVVKLDHCTIWSKGLYNAVAVDTCRLDAQDSQFSTGGVGFAVLYYNYSRGKLERSEFSNNAWGPEVYSSAQVTMDACTVTKNGEATGGGCALIVSGNEASLTVTGSKFTENPGTVLALEGGTLKISNSEMTNNGVGGNAVTEGHGLVSAQGGARATLDHVKMTDNKQGLTALFGGTLECTDLTATRTGFTADNPGLLVYGNAVSVFGTDSAASVIDSTITDSRVNGIVVSIAGKLVVKGTTVTGSKFEGLHVGEAGSAPAFAELSNSAFRHGSLAGAWVTGGSTVTADRCEFTDNNTGIEVAEANTRVTLSGGVVRGNVNAGLMVYRKASAQADGSIFENNLGGVQAGFPNASAGGSVTLENCTIHGNTNFGLCAVAGGTLTYRKTTLSGNGYDLCNDASGTVRQLQ